MLDITFDSFPSLNAASPVAVALLCQGADSLEGGVFQTLDDACDGALLRAVALKGFTGEKGKSLSLLAPSEALTQIVLVGCGGRAGEAANAVDVENAAGTAVKAIEGVAKGILALTDGLEPFAPEAALGARLARYDFDLYRTRKAASGPALESLKVAVSDAEGAKARWTVLEAVSQGIFLTRNLVSEPANILYPEVFAERIEGLRELGLEVEILDRDRMEELGFGALLGVAQGSSRAPRTVILRHRGGGEEAPLAFIGKGVTFDSGGISIKPAAGMDEMKTDMGGAATVVGLMSTLARRKAAVNAIGVVGLVENMVSGDAQRPGDIVKAYDGQTIEVLNTDAEGRLVLADVLSYARDRFKPKLMIDLATLTGAIVVSLGYENAGLFSNDDALASGLFGAGQEVGEGLWRMPMGEAYNRQIDSDIADMKNIGGRPGSAILAAEFLKRFVGETPWAHLDIAGTTWKNTASPIAPKGATGFGVRLLDRFVQMHEHNGRV
ncbi:leucyl aminopeptidase [Gluconobacter morbifer]|uniref:Probable cytosol aminopeptidase n=1 Tax=Gluconobacter morbifer G707 TaxID=1088869 RepID=G6XLD2_9PROT|nr:leucyl aminopeptidase [Gluconobacter morbifer]EHH67187.1 leucyl aminopeptidase [Gluconobacter morbifer G707]